MIQDYALNIQTEIIRVTRDKVNEAGLFTTCNMLQQVNNINDNTLASVLGTLEYARVRIAQYHISFQGQAACGDTVRIESTSELKLGKQLEIALKITKAKKKKQVQIGAGNFTFIIKTI